jgi:hypothetical protein
MSPASDRSGTPAQPVLPDLLARYLQRQSAAQAAGFAPPQATGEVVPFEAAPVQPVEPRLAWEEAVAALPLFQPGLKTDSWPVPPEWPTLVSAHEPAVALAFCAGNFPQLVRNLHPLLHVTDLAALRPDGARPIYAPALPDWAGQVARQHSYPQRLLAVGVLRLARQFEAAEALAREVAKAVPAPWQAAWANEAAALAWHEGRAHEAAEQWRALPASTPVLFNRGMAALFLDRPTEGRTSLTEAVNQLPEDHAWHHLGRLYLALAEMRG